jgi:hypothetical protein
LQAAFLLRDKMGENFVHREVRANLAEQESCELMSGKKVTICFASMVLAEVAVEQSGISRENAAAKNPGNQFCNSGTASVSVDKLCIQKVPNERL